MANFLSELLSGMKATYQPAADNYSEGVKTKQRFDNQQLLQKQEQLYEEKKRTEERQAAELIKEKDSRLIQLLGDPDLTRQDYTAIYNQISKDGQKVASDIRKEFAPKPIKTKIFNGDLYGFDPVTGQPDPIPIMKGEPRIANTSYGRHQDGRYGLFRTFEDGKSDFWDTGRIPDSDLTGKTTTNEEEDEQRYDKWTIKQFNTVMNQLTNTLTDMENYRRKVAQLQDYGDPNEVIANVNNMNTIADNGRQSVYAIMPDEIKEYVDIAEASLQQGAKAAGMDTQQYLDKNKGYFQKKFMERMTQIWNDNQINDKDYRTLSAWARFRYEYMPMPKLQFEEE